MAMATVVTNFAAIFRDLGTSAAIIQRPQLSDAETNAAFWLNIFLGAAVALLIAACAPVISNIFHEPRLAPVLLVLCLAFPFASSGAAHQALMERESQFKAIARIEISSVVIGLAAAISLAALGAGVYSLVAQSVITAALSSAQLWRRSCWRPTSLLRVRTPALKPIVSFGSNLAAFNVINYFSRNSDALVIGHYMTSAVLGAYSLAYRIMLFPLQSMTFVASRSLYPLLSRRNGDTDGVRATYLKLLSVVSALVAPMMAGMVAVRQDFVEVFIGPQWQLTSALLAWLAPTGFLQAIVSTTGVIFMSTGRVRLLLGISIFNAATQLTAFVAGAQLGVTYMAAFYLLANLINFIPNMALAMSVLNGGVTGVFAKVAPPAVAAVIMAGLLTAISAHSTIESISPVSRLLVQIPLGVLFYLATLRVISPVTISHVLDLIRR